MQEVLEARVKRLEQENRAIKRGALLALLLAVGAVFMGQTQESKVSDAIRTRKLVVVDEAERARFVLTVSAEGPALHFSDEAGNSRLVLAVTKEGPGLALADEAGHVRASLSAMDEGVPALILSDEAGQERVGITTRKEGPSIALVDEAGFSATLGATSLVTPKTGATTKRSAASLVLFDSQNNVIWDAPR